MHQGNKIKFIKFDKDDSAQLKFLKENVRNFYTRDIAMWQYENDEFCTGLYFFQENDSYISSQGMIPVYLNVKGKQTLTAKSESSFLLPEFRGKGIFENLYFYTIEKSEEDGIQIIWGFTALSKVWRNKLKFDVYDGVIHESEIQINFFLSLYSIWQSKQSFISKAKLSIKSLYALTKKNQLHRPSKDYISMEIDKNNQTHLSSIFELYRKWQSEHPDFVSIHINEEFLTWRIFNNPIAKYKIIGIFKNHLLVCIGIVNVTYNKSYLVDFIVLEKEDLNQCFSELIIFLKQYNTISHLIYWASSKNSYTKKIHSLFHSYGAFCYINNSMNFVVKKTQKATYDNIDLSEYYINGLWTEGFLI